MKQLLILTSLLAALAGCDATNSIDTKATNTTTSVAKTSNSNQAKTYGKDSPIIVDSGSTVMIHNKEKVEINTNDPNESISVVTRGVGSPIIASTNNQGTAITYGNNSPVIVSNSGSSVTITYNDEPIKTGKSRTVITKKDGNIIIQTKGDRSPAINVNTN